jgi:hypothetical protein
MATYYVKQMQRIVQDYRDAGQPWPTSSKNMADWAILTGRWEMPVAAIRRRCADDIASAMREEYMTDAKGRRVRVLHPRHFSRTKIERWFGTTSVPLRASTCKCRISIGDRELWGIVGR